MRQLAAVFAVVLLAGCSPDPGAAPSPPASGGTRAPDAVTSSGPPTTTPVPSRPQPAATTPSARPLAGAAAAWQVRGEGFDNPVQVLVDPAGRVLVVEQPGRIRTLDGATTVLDLTDRVTSGGEQGLLAAAFSPDGSQLFLHYSGGGGRTVLSRFPVDDRGVAAAQEAVLFERAQPAANHNGGSLLFDPDGALVLALGDGGGAGDRFDNGQDPATVLGALLRFRVHGGEVDPDPDNPFVGGGGAPEVWAYGLRNPWRVAVDQDHLYVADVGQDAVEEVNVLPRGDVAGANFGWPVLEGPTCFSRDDCDPSGTVLPVAELRHADGACSIIGGVVVPDGHPTGLGGAYLYSDLCDPLLRALRADDPSGPVVVAGATVPASPLGFGAGPDGQVWVGTVDGQVLELVPA